MKKYFLTFAKKINRHLALLRLCLMEISHTRREGGPEGPIGPELRTFEGPHFASASRYYYHIFLI